MSKFIYTHLRNKVWPNGTRTLQYGFSEKREPHDGIAWQDVPDTLAAPRLPEQIMFDSTNFVKAMESLGLKQGDIEKLVEEFAE